MQATLGLEDAVRRAYSQAAQCPDAEHPFPVGRRFAESIGYPSDLLDSFSPAACEGFAGVSSVSVVAELRKGASVLDLGCGAGLDAFIAARRVGKTGRVVGVDFSAAMLARARQAAREMNVRNASFYNVDARYLPFGDASFEIATVNGIFNLNPARAEIFAELARVMRPGGSVWAAELIATESNGTVRDFDASTWFA